MDASTARKQRWGKVALSGQMQECWSPLHAAQSQLDQGQAHIILSLSCPKPSSSRGRPNESHRGQVEMVVQVIGAGTTLDWWVVGGRKPSPFSSISLIFSHFLLSPGCWDTNHQDLLRVPWAWLTGPGGKFFKGRGCCSTWRKVPSRGEWRSRLTAGRIRSC